MYITRPREKGLVAICVFGFDLLGFTGIFDLLLRSLRLARWGNTKLTSSFKVEVHDGLCVELQLLVVNKPPEHKICFLRCSCQAMLKAI